ncbi:hypothetical protein EYF80_064768 [Liparis tanakae]|uniref:Uncharacterized protein n=1 Tax=Liparis tanakae TaxID=230148 RepID=A0A4Z2E9A1_9TELE|nr:hypothetical protein EYF80_064768 [Liparis tanakae]
MQDVREQQFTEDFFSTCFISQLKQRLKDQGLDDDIKLSWRKQSDGKVFHKEEKKNKKYIDEL